MLRTLSLFHVANGIQNVFRVHISSSSSVSREKWDLFTAVCLERRPVVTPALNEIEKEYKQYMSDLELERSLKSNIELRHEMELKQLEALKKGEEVGDIESSLKETAQDLMDMWNDEASKFQPASKTTEADQKNDLKSLSRKLDRHLVLVLNQKIGNKHFYVPPQAMHQDGETLRQAAERTLKQTVGPGVKAQIYGNAPCGFFKYKYPHNLKDENGKIGAKVFIYFARYLEGQIAQKNLDYKWLDRKELQTTLAPQYSHSLNQFLFDE